MRSALPDESKAYSRQDCSIDMGKASVYSLLLTGPVVILLGVLYVGVWGFQTPADQVVALLKTHSRLLAADLLLLMILILGTPIHEFIHGITWRLAGKKPWSAIKFGFQWRTLTPYTHCCEPLPVNVYRVGTWMPGFLTGVVPGLVGVWTGNVWVALVGGLFILVAGGDALILWLLRGVDRRALVEDHPTRAGCYVLSEGVDGQSETDRV